MSTLPLPLPANEHERLQCLLDYELLDSQPDEKLDQLTRLAASIFNVPIVLITLLDENRQWFKSAYGLGIKETDRNISFCQYTIQNQKVFEVENALKDRRFMQNPLVLDDPTIRYYCGAPLVNERGYALGSLALLDRAPRKLDDSQKKTLELLAHQVVNSFELNHNRKKLEAEKQTLEQKVAQRTRDLEQNIRELQHRNEAFWENEHMFTAAQRLAKMGSWQVDLRTNALVASAPLYSLMHLPQKPGVLDTVDDFFKYVHPDDVDTLRKNFTHYVQTGKDNMMGYRLLLPDGTVKFLYSVGDLQKDAQGNPWKVWGICQDVTAQRQAEQAIRDYSQQLEDYSQRLEKANASKDKFFSLIAHDLQSPVNGILSATGLLSQHIQTLAPADVQALATGIHTSTQQFRRFLGDLLQWANVQRGNMTFNPVRLNLRQTIDNVFEMVMDIAEKKKIQLHNFIDDGVLVNADEQMLHTILRNLLTNAIKFSNTDGQVTLTCQVKPEQVEISVSDSGIGMSPAVQAQLFRLDTKQSVPGTANEKGNGLGLLLCQEFVEKHDGRIRVESEEGKGSTFTFSVPRQAK